MKKLISLIALISIILFVSSCNGNTEQKAINELLKHQTYKYAIVVFSDGLIEDTFTANLQNNVDKINNQKLSDAPITDVFFVDIRDNNKYDYANIFKLSSYPQIILFEEKRIIFETNQPSELLNYFKDS